MSTMNFLVIAFGLKAQASKNKVSEDELYNIAKDLKDDLGLGMTDFDSVTDAVYALPQRHREGGRELSTYDLLNTNVQSIKMVGIVPMFATIWEILSGFVSGNHIESSGFSNAYGTAVVEHGKKANQLGEDAKFIAFPVGYRWRSSFSDRFREAARLS